MTRWLTRVQQLLPALLTTRAASRTICHRHLMSLGPDPRSLCERYTDETYARMRDDHARTCAYEQAIKAVASGRVCLDIGTGALGLLAVMAARAGAAHVYAIEANAQAYAAAVQTVADLQLSDRVTVLQGYSTDVQLPRRVDLLLHEILGEMVVAEARVGVSIECGRVRHVLIDESLLIRLHAETLGALRTLSRNGLSTRSNEMPPAPKAIVTNAAIKKGKGAWSVKSDNDRNASSRCAVR